MEAYSTQFAGSFAGAARLMVKFDTLAAVRVQR